MWEVPGVRGGQAGAASPKGLSGTGHLRMWEGARTMGRTKWTQQGTAQVQSECQCDSESMGQWMKKYPRGGCHQGVAYCQLWERPQGDP